MSYLKYGIVTKIENTESDVVKNIFNLKLYKQKRNYYLLKESILNKNLKEFRKEIISLSKGQGDSINNCEAYCLETNADLLLENKIHYIDNDDKYYFENHEDFVFDFEKAYYFTDKICLKLNYLSLFWDTNKITIEDFIALDSFLNNISKKALNNCLKEASLFTII